MVIVKKAIIVKNRYTVKSNGVGSSGSTPGKFVLRYMSRDERGATEPLVPFTLDDNDVPRKDARYSARGIEIDNIKASNISHNNEDVKKRLKSIDGLGGRAFGSRNLSLSDRELREDSRKIQAAFDEGHTAQLMVISFSEKFLKEHNVLDSDFVYKGDRSYQNMYDQMKMRIAISRGINDMLDVHDYQNPVWVATLQTDTSHLHAHLAVVDTEFSDKRLRVDGTERGKINDKEKDALRHGIAHELDLMSHYSFRQKNKERDLQNVRGLVKDLDFHEASYNKELQLILGSLPEDKLLWDVNNVSPEMRYPNELSRQFVNRLFNDYGEQTGYNAAITKLSDYAYRNSDNEEMRKTMIANGKQSIEDVAINAIYHKLDNVSRETSLIPKEGMLLVQSMDDDTLKKAVVDRGDRDEEFDPFGFELRSRAYRDRTVKHMREVKQNYENKQEYDNQQQSLDSQVMIQFYINEMLYHAKLVDKYRSFSAYDVTWDESVREDYDVVKRQYDAIVKTEELLNMPLDDIAKEYGYKSLEDAKNHQSEFSARVQEIDGIENGQRLLSYNGHVVMEQQLHNMHDSYQKANEDYAYRGFMAGSLNYRELTDTLTDRDKIPYPPQASSNLYDESLFNEVQALDLHDLDVDFYGVPDVEISRQSIEQFADSYNERVGYYTNANQYLKNTYQDVNVLKSCRNDLVKMSKTLTDLYDKTYDIPEIEYNDMDVKTVTETISLDENVQVLETIQNELDLEF